MHHLLRRLARVLELSRVVKEVCVVGVPSFARIKLCLPLNTFLFRDDLTYVTYPNLQAFAIAE